MPFPEILEKLSINKPIRNSITKSVNRGKVDVRVKLKSAAQTNYVIDASLIKKLENTLKKNTSLKNKISFSDIKDVPGILNAEVTHKLNISTVKQEFNNALKDFLDSRFENDHIKACFGFDSIVGNYASPETPGSAYVLLHHVFGEIDGEKGAWGHALGGMGSITQIMRTVCEEIGVDISTNASVKNIIVEDSVAKGVVLDDGSKIMSNKVISNLNPKLLFTNLINHDDVDKEYLRKILNYKCGSGTFRMNVALSELPNFNCLPGKEIAEHHKSGIIIAPTLTYMDEAFTDAKKHGWAKNPIVEMLIPSTGEQSLAPEGKHVASLFCQQFAPKLPMNKSWHDEKTNAAETIIDTVNKYAPNFKKSIIGSSILSPLDLEEKLGLLGGDIMHGVMTLDQMWAARPVFNYGDYKTPIKNLFICGSGSHPGGGVTGLPGKNSSREILKS